MYPKTWSSPWLARLNFFTSIRTMLNGLIGAQHGLCPCGRRPTILNVGPGVISVHELFNSFCHRCLPASFKSREPPKLVFNWISSCSGSFQICQIHGCHPCLRTTLCSCRCPLVGIPFLEGMNERSSTSPSGDSMTIGYDLNTAQLYPVERIECCL
jgi:hypothetical protein